MAAPTSAAAHLALQRAEGMLAELVPLPARALRVVAARAERPVVCPRSETRFARSATCVAKEAWKEEIQMETEVEWVADHGQIMECVMLMARNHAYR